VNRRERKSVKARSKGTQTELIVQIDNGSTIVIPSHHRGTRQRQRSQVMSRSDSDTVELRCVTPTRPSVVPANESTTVDSSCSEDDSEAGGEDITEKEMTWLTQLSEQPSVTSSHDITNTDSELDDSFLLNYEGTTEISISPLPPTPCVRLNDSMAVTSGDEEGVSVLEEGQDMLQDDGNCWSPAQPEMEQATLISSHDLDGTTDQSEQDSKV